MDWFECGDVDIFDDQTGDRVYSGPKFLRCHSMTCNRLVTHGQIDKMHSCDCGNRKVKPALQITEEEKAALLNRAYPLNWWEEEMIFGEKDDAGEII